MSSESSKKRKPKVIQSNGAPAEGKQNRSDTEQEGKYYIIQDTCQEIQSCVHFMTLKKLNRLAHIRLKKGRDQTHEAEQKVDAYHLQLQNLLYEVMHLQKEITKCLEFKSKHEEIDLVRLEEFYKEAPPDISKAEVTVGDPHQQTLLHLNSIMQASLPVQEYLFMPFDQAHKQYETARHLPPPLYVLFVQATAYGQAYDKTLSVAIEGRVDEAKALFKPPEDSQDDKSDSDAEEEQTTKRWRPTLGVQLDDKHKEMQTSHRSSIMLDLKCKDDSVLHLTFFYLMNLNIMTVKAKVTTATELITPISAGDLLSPDSVLSCLYPGDHGKKTPNPANQYQIDKVGILTLSDYILELGHSYLWVQKLDGLHFPKEQCQQTVISGHSLSTSHMETTMKLRKTRVLSHLALHKQFASLEHGIVPVTSDCQYLFPARVVSHLVKWMTVAHEDYMELHFTKDIVDAGLAGDTNLYYMAVIERGRATLQAAVVLNPGYSSIPPIFQLCLNWKGEKTNSNDDNIQAMESKVNVCCKELCGPWPSHQLLTNHLQRLCVLLDVYLETESHDDSVEGPKEFPQKKMYLRLFRGPGRMKPFKYNHPQGFFSHR
uniref:THO complex 5 n=1 Tax=Aotus nancymaae TaxID=37293 RepID=A0A2K5CBT1_AOTNA